MHEDQEEDCRRKERAFFELAERFRSATDPDEVKRLGEVLGRLVFGDRTSTA